jgi:hypothetical protein
VEIGLTLEVLIKGQCLELMKLRAMNFNPSLNIGQSILKTFFTMRQGEGIENIILLRLGGSRPYVK